MAKKKKSELDKIKVEMDKLMKKYQPAMKKTGKQLVKAVQVAEEDIAKMYKVAQTHVEIQMTNIKKERLYHEIGKLVARKLMRGELEGAGLDKFKKQLDKLETEGDKKKKLLERASKEGKKRKNVKTS
ncbi:hypothetical protein ACFL4E_03180 [Candidatus Omnitrophota bacterium]